MALFFTQVAFGMDLNIISGKNNKFTESVSLSFHGVEEASFDLFHKVLLINYLPFCHAIYQPSRVLKKLKNNLPFGQTIAFITRNSLGGGGGG